MEPQRLTFALPDPAATNALGRGLAATLRPGDIVALEGGLGAGKTALARSTIRTLVGDPELEVPSPSFALVQPYEAGERQILHVDLYRLADAREIDELGILDADGAILLVEWPERAPDLAARATLSIRLDLDSSGDGRIAKLSWLDSSRDFAAAARAAGLGPPETF